MFDSTHEQPQTKKCNKCGETKLLDAYSRDRSRVDGLSYTCKACVAERTRVWQKNNSERKAETNRAWYAANRERAAETRRAWWKANPEKVAKYNARNRSKYNRAWKKDNPERVAELMVRHRAKYPDRYAARQAVSYAVKRGDFPPASALVCDHCQEAQAEQYHHHLGYAPEHQLDVIPVCIPCHVELDRG